MGAARAVVSDTRREIACRVPAGDVPIDAIDI
jgi:hypothetical protein